MGYRRCVSRSVLTETTVSETSVTPVFQTIGQEEFDRLRSLSYAETHVVMMCFSVSRHSQRQSF